MVHTTCTVSACKSSSRINKELRFHQFPHDDERAKKAQQSDTPTTSSDVPKVAQEAGPSQSDEKELCMKIKNSLKQLRRQSTGETESKDNEDPTLCLEVFLDQPVDAKTEEKPGAGDETKEPSSEFHDESEPPELPNSKKIKKDPKIYKFPAKPLKRNPIRKVVIEKEIQKSIIAARNAPALEKVYVGSVDKPIEKAQSKTAKRARLEPLETHFSHTEKLYEFGKYVAEQMMCFDETDVNLAQAEIKEVLTKFRLKYKIMNLLKPNEKPDSDAERQPVSLPVTQANPTRQTKPTPMKTYQNPMKTYQNPMKTYQKTMTKSAPRAPASSVTLGSQFSQENAAGLSTTKNGSQMTAGSIPSGSQVNIAGGSTSNGAPITPGLSGLPQLVSVVPSLKELQVLNPSSSPTTFGFVVVPTSLGFQLSSQHIKAGIIGPPLALQRCTPAMRPLVTQPVSSHIVSTGSLATQQDMNSATKPLLNRPGPSHTISTEPTVTQAVANSACGSSVIQPGSSVISTRPLVTQPNMKSTTKISVTAPESYIISTMPLVTQQNVAYAITKQNVELPSVTEPGSSRITLNNPVVTQPENSETSGPPFKMPPTHFIDVIPENEPESLIVKCEMESDEEM